MYVKQFKITTISLYPNPENLNGGNVHIHVFYGFIVIANNDEAICDLGSPIKCPIQMGPFNKTFSVSIPSNVPSGEYNGI
ncbi:hypothetical protein PPL_00957 [Heterostelium album PN500]|uniref:MD-2-related lipid-recognition domain-containing protein n=1 Tax=Heterostelium pallidum (strain ATCC 26659 / Pp 5 / PN500) TaxID=670386 RepID=D3AXQ0_HETP5|nr:hypothetical protein PPL_00957 [Heterostelium album PN500]EFA85727.1 hypothetical protein PPL_00957 [Heterostelium album PN500]|eukprot:XP_020437833.1 hypothetical protein PPL_00957 [Heterostelium album PN500]